MTIEVKATRVDPEEKMRAEVDSFFIRIRDNAGELVIKELLKFRKKIPQRGLNNVSKCGWRYGFDGPATLPSRMNKLKWSIPYLPPQMVGMALAGPDFDKEKARTLLVDILQLLADLRRNLRTVTVIEPPEWWREMIGAKERYLRSTAIPLGLVHKVEFEVLDSPNEEREGGEEELK